jgi:hypothetical protein
MEKPVSDDNAKHLKNTRYSFPTSVRYLVADGYYYRSKFWDAVRELNLDFIGKLRVDANLPFSLVLWYSGCLKTVRSIDRCKRK